MIQAVKEDYIGVIFFLIQMENPKEFRLNWKMDEKFSSAVNLAMENGVEILAYDSIVNKNRISIGQRIKIDLTK